MGSNDRQDAGADDSGGRADQTVAPAGSGAEGDTGAPSLDDRLSLDSAGKAPRGGFDADGRARDYLGRIIPSRVNWLKLIRAVPQLVAGPERAFRRTVPQSFWTLDTDDEGAAVALVSCPCGETPEVPISRVVECQCERFYFALVSRVLVANSPQDREPETPVS